MRVTSYRQELNNPSLMNAYERSKQNAASLNQAAHRQTKTQRLAVPAGHLNRHERRKLEKAMRLGPPKPAKVLPANLTAVLASGV